MCGVFGVWAPGEDVAKLTYFGLYALQHRGQESAGIAVSNGRQILVYKDMGLVSQVFDETTLDSFQGHLAIGHARYSTTGASTWQNAQPTFRPTADGSIALGHNGNLINTHELARLVDELPDPDGELDVHSRKLEASTNDTGLVTALLAHHPDTSLEQRALEVLPLLEGAFSFVWMNENTLYAARDPQGIRPLVLGPPRPRLGRRLRGRGPGHHRRQRGPRGRARRADRHRRARPALAQVRRAARARAASSSTSTSPARTPRSPASPCTRPGSRWAASWPASSRSRPTW